MTEPSIQLSTFIHTFVIHHTCMIIVTLSNYLCHYTCNITLAHHGSELAESINANLLSLTNIVSVCENYSPCGNFLHRSWRDIIIGVCMPNMMPLSLVGQKLWPRLKLTTDRRTCTKKQNALDFFYPGGMRLKSLSVTTLLLHRYCLLFF